ncbi:MAG TPA: histidine kinase [Jatrophihabitans sp.]|nr:histidine kinase [Jatrophihabitans sp.]
MTQSASRQSFTPPWWRVTAWVALIALTVYSTQGVGNRISAGVLMSVSIIALQLLGSVPLVGRWLAPQASLGRRWPAPQASLGGRRVLLFVATAAGLAACYFAHNGAAEVPVFLAAARAPDALDGAALRWFVVLDTVAVGVTIGIIANSIPAVLAGAGIPLLVQRSLDHRELVRERDRAQALLAEVQAGREAETQAAALRERGRIAREMHDVLAHSLAGLSVQLQAARAVATRADVGDTVLDPLDKAAELARAGLAEARAAVGALRDPVGLGLDALPALVDRHPGTATLTLDGPAATVSPEAGHAVYRAVQESLTNAARYAPGSPVTVTLCWRPETLEIVVADTGPAPDRDVVTGQGTGLGLAGMAERIQQVGGNLRAGPDGIGWRVTLTVPASCDPIARP